MFIAVFSGLTTSCRCADVIPRRPVDCRWRSETKAACLPASCGPWRQGHSPQPAAYYVGRAACSVPPAAVGQRSNSVLAGTGCRQLRRPVTARLKLFPHPARVVYFDRSL